MSIRNSTLGGRQKISLKERDVLIYGDEKILIFSTEDNNDLLSSDKLMDIAIGFLEEEKYLFDKKEDFNKFVDDYIKELQSIKRKK